VHLDTYDLAHYAIYSQVSLMKLVILNTHYFNGTGIRGEKYLGVPSVLGTQLSVKRLTAPNALVKTGLTWAGQSVDASGNLVGRVEVESVRDGVVMVEDGEAVIVWSG